MADALGVLEARAQFDAPAQEVFVRVAEADGNIYVDLGDEAWRAIKISPTGWKVVRNPAVRFRRPRGMRPLPRPQRRGSLEELREFLNVGSDTDWHLVKGWLVQAMRPTGPYPILAIHGGHGTAKTTFAGVLGKLIDPCTTELRSEPKEEQDLMIAAVNRWALSFDNLSRLPAWLSDGMCRLATGGGLGKRELWTDQDEVLLEAKRPQIMNGIEELATRADLLDRALILYLPEIPDLRRKGEQGFWADFERALPRILGGLLDVLSAGLRNLPTVRLKRLPRMADFARWVTACEPAFGWPAGTFLKAYAENRAASHDLTLAASPVAEPVRALAEVSGDKGWMGTPTELLKRLTPSDDEIHRRPSDWPLTPQGLSNALRRVASNLREVGIVVEFGKHNHKRVISINLNPAPIGWGDTLSAAVERPQSASCWVLRKPH